jgi:hypothetical protein
VISYTARVESPFQSSSPWNPSGQRIGRYRIVRPLSKGGMALVYEGRRESLAGVSPRVAIKLILPEHASSETFKELFINEAKLGASMQHQNLVQIQDFDCADDRYFLVMEYVEGLTLRKVIALSERAQIRLPLGVIAELGRQACDGLHYAHNARDEQGRPLHLVHRDIKPSNLILNPQGVVKVLDFGISKGRLREERKGSVKGTWGYMAPEQAVGAEVSPTADVFGLAVVLYELASLRAMFVDQGKDEIRRLLKDDHAARMAATLDGKEYGPMIGVLVRALQRDPSARYESAEAFGRALSALLPDPITDRDEVTRFYQKLDALDRGSRSPRGAVRSDDAAGSLVAAGRPEDDRLGVGAIATFVAGATLALALLGGIALVWLFTMGIERSPSEEPAPVVEQEREPPQVGVAPVVPVVPVPTPGPKAPVPMVEPAGPSADPAPAAPASEEPVSKLGTVVVDAVQPAEVYLAGQYVSATPMKQELPAGTYTFALVAHDGRRRTFEVTVEAGGKATKSWDFDRMEWKEE